MLFKWYKKYFKVGTQCLNNQTKRLQMCRQFAWCDGRHDHTSRMLRALISGPQKLEETSQMTKDDQINSDGWGKLNFRYTQPRDEPKTRMIDRVMKMAMLQTVACHWWWLWDNLCWAESKTICTCSRGTILHKRKHDEFKLTYWSKTPSNPQRQKSATKNNPVDS